MISYFLWFYFLTSFFSFSRAAGVRNTTVGSQDSSITFTPDWQSVFASEGAFKSTDEPGAALDVTLPNGAVSVSYVGFKQSGGALYGICLDCDDSGEGSFAVVDGHDPTGNGQESPTTLFTITGIDPTFQHTLTVVNLPDPRFNNTGQLTFDSLGVGSSNTGSTGDPSLTVADSPTDPITFTSILSEQSGATKFMSQTLSIPSVPSATSKRIFTSDTSSTPTSTTSSSKSRTSSISGTVLSYGGLTSVSSTRSTKLVSSVTSTAPISSSTSQSSATTSQSTLLPSGTSNGANGANMLAQRTALSNSSIALITTLLFLALFFLILIILVLIRRRRQRLRYLARRQRTPGVLSSWTPPENTVDLPPEEGRMSEIRPESSTPTRPSRFAQGVPSFIWEPTQPLQPRPRVEDSGGPGPAWATRSPR